MKRIDLTGLWQFALDQEKVGIEEAFYLKDLTDEIVLPATVASAEKGIPNEERHIDHLTDPYFFEGFTWFAKEIELEELSGKDCFLHLERTRISHVWVNCHYVGSHESLCTAHEYCLTPYVTEGRHKITIMVDNASYSVKGGHMTSPDTQTNWNGITGEIYVELRDKNCLTEVRLSASYAKKELEMRLVYTGAGSAKLRASIMDEEEQLAEQKDEIFCGENVLHFRLPETIKAWSEHTPKLYTLKLDLAGEEYCYSFGVRDFKAQGSHFTINGERTFLRGKHDGLIFPLTGYAPTDMESWLKVMSTAKEYGINHYRFHTCCPPEAAFCAADILGIYMEPELPFWGTMTTEADENHDAKGQEYLIEEGYRILDEFGNHPSFVMMSLGNELWGSKERLNEILGEYRLYDDRHLYTQGSNNFQFMPCVLENEDFFCGVRLSKDRLFRGSYAMCDAPQGHIQTDRPNSVHHYDTIIRPSEVQEGEASGGEVTIQYGTGTKTVQMDASGEFVPKVPVVSHEIGQFAMYPDFQEIEKYTGVLKARNFEVYKERLQKAGMIEKADLFFQASGRLAVDCYKAELEAALRTNELAGFQILDLQDFSGQGTALVGVLDAFMESKGVAEAREWRQFCSEAVILAEFPQFVYEAGQQMEIGFKLACFRLDVLENPIIKLAFFEEEKEVFSSTLAVSGSYQNGVYSLGSMKIECPLVQKPTQLEAKVSIAGTEMENLYDLWIYPPCEKLGDCAVVVTDETQEMLSTLEQGKKVLFYPTNLNDSNSIEGTYCTDFWCYPMFRSISESMNKKVPVGTHGLLIQNEHPVFEAFPTNFYTTAQWYDIVSHSRALIMDTITLDPIVSTIDNFERNHRLGNLWEAKVGSGALFVCTAKLSDLEDSLPAKWLEKSILNYMSSDSFKPFHELQTADVKNLFGICSE